MAENTPIARRVILTAGSAGVLGASALVLAACTPGGAGTTDAGAGASTGSAAATPAPAATAGASSATAGGAEIAKLADVPVGEGASVTFEGKDILVAQPTAGSVVAFSSVCPHQGCAVAFAKTDFACPCHGSNFDLATGDVTKGPAQTGLTKINVAVSGDSIVAA